MKKVCFLLAMLILLLCGCTDGGNKPYEPDAPEPAAHDGLFGSEHGSLRFNGDKESVEIDFDDTLAELTGLLEGEHMGTYVFLSGDLPPNGSVPARYDAAHEVKITVGDKSAVIALGIAAEDGKTARTGVGTVTPERIPMLFYRDGTSFSIIFLKEDTQK